MVGIYLSWDEDRGEAYLSKAQPSCSLVFLLKERYLVFLLKERYYGHYNKREQCRVSDSFYPKVCLACSHSLPGISPRYVKLHGPYAE
jgi:hypothetical protein